MVPPPALTLAQPQQLNDIDWRAAFEAQQGFRSVAVPIGAGQFWRKMLAYAGPGCLVAVGYMDPGNWATDLAGGSQFGYAILPVIVFSNFVAMFLQHLSLKLGIASGCDLARTCRLYYSKKMVFILWLAAEIAIVACDLAEVIGTAVALKLLFDIPLLLGTLLTIADTLCVLVLMKRGMRSMEAFITSLFLLIGGCFMIELSMAQPDISAMGKSFLHTQEIITNPAMLYIALGIFGATVMPHNLYLHSSLVQSRRFGSNVESKREAIRFATLDSNGALMIALLVNGAILVLAAAIFHSNGLLNVIDIQDAHRLMTPLLGTVAGGILFGIALLASGQNSTITGTLAGQIVMEGMLGLKMNPLIRRFLTRCLAIVPAFGVIWMAQESALTELLILSQVILSLQLAFAVIPLIIFTNNKAIMGPFANSPRVKVTAIIIAILVVAVNGWLVIQTLVA